jgi:Tat protein translocase TatB subunit
VLNVGTPELIVICLVALLVLGPDKLPAAARKVGNVLGEVRRMSAGFQAEMRDALQEPVHLPPAEPAAPLDTDEPPSAVQAVEPDAGDEIPPA